MITTVAFDADDTLVDIRAAVTAGLHAVTAAVADPALTLELFTADADEHWTLLPDHHARDIRAAAMRYTLARSGREHELDRWLELFFEVRYAHSRPFPEVPAVLDKLSRDYRLGYATNANSLADRCGLGGRFAFELYALENGVPKKPARGFFEAVLAAASAQPDEVVYVGDSYAHDVAGAAAAGLRTVWLNRSGAPAPGPVRPDVMITDLAQLPDAVAQLQG
ncbi:HAD family hydrolase [Catellatospora methionotrophica]|uniref:HAD family hydrolase n=1 Tax=Catellatospora methionotrophica TaxID=121620 RepID=UPI0033D1E4B7